MVSFLYELGLILFSLYALPKMLLKRYIHGKYKDSLLKRFGKDFPKIKKEGRALIWIHAVSYGETRAIIPLVKKLKQEHQLALFLISSITETGYLEAKKNLAFADYHVYLPFDFRSIIFPIVDYVKPDLVLLSETDFWFNFLLRCKENGGKIAVVNGKISDRSLSNFLKIPLFSKKLFSLIDLFCLQNEEYKNRFLELNISEERMKVTGNIKFDAEPSIMSSQDLKNWKNYLGLKEDEKVIVFGSTHDPEEKIFLNTLEKLWTIDANVKAILVPRHPDRFSEIHFLLTSKNIPHIPLSKIAERKGDEKIILVDGLGQLKKCYQVANVAVVGGSYTQRVGGHNIIEPSEFGVPVLFGPFMHTQEELVSLVKEYVAGFQVSEENLYDKLLHLLENKSECDKIGVNGKRLVNTMKGSIDRTFNHIKNLFP